MTTGARISLGMIVRDEARSLGALLQQVRPHVDEIVVVDTGSTDATVEIARQYADRVETFTACNDAEGHIADFSAARNHALSLCSHDWLLWLDGDDLVSNPAVLRQLAASAPEGEPLAVLAPYEYSYAPDGSVSCLLWRERLVWPRREFEWTGAVHETLGRRDGRACGLRTEAFRVLHRRQGSGKPADPGRNLRILEAAAARAGGPDARTAHYLGVELAAAGRHPEAVTALRLAASLREDWPEARYATLLALSKSLDELGDEEGAVRAASDAAQERRGPEPYYQMARVRARTAEAQRDWARVAHFARLGLSLQDGHRDALLPGDPGEAAGARSLLMTACGRLGPADVSALMRPLEPSSPAEARDRILRDLPAAGLPERTAQLVGVLVRGETEVEVEVRMESAPRATVPVGPRPPVFPTLTIDMVGRPPRY